MSIFKKHVCSECSRKISFVAKRFNEEKILCKKCASILDSAELMPNISYEVYKEIKEYQEKNYEQSRKIFRETYAYQNIHVDTENRLFYIGYSINADTIFLSLKHLSTYQFNYFVSQNAKPFFGSVPCDVRIHIQMKHPNISYMYTLPDRAKAKFEDSDYEMDWFGNEVFTETYSHDWPKSLKKFIEIFDDVSGKKQRERLAEGLAFSDAIVAANKSFQEMCVDGGSAYNEYLEEAAMLEYYDTLDMPEKQKISRSEYKEVIEYLNNTEE